MKQKIILCILALLCSVVQRAWADKWDGSTKTKPTVHYTSDGYTGGNGRYYIPIYSAAELAFVAENWGKRSYEFGEMEGFDYYYNKCDIELYADLDMTAGTWKPLGSDEYEGTFYGNGHTIRIKIDDSSISDNNQGLFGKIAESGKVMDLHVDGKIKVGNARLVGGIAGDNYGTIENCWVSADVESSHYSSYDADLGGICGLNESDGTVKFCCMTGNVKNTGNNSGVGGIAGRNNGTIQHITFYGSVDVNYSQNNKYVGKQDGTLDDVYDTYSDAHYSYASGNNMYRCGIKYPKLPETVIISNDEDWEEFRDFVNHNCTFSGKTVRLYCDVSTEEVLCSSDMGTFKGIFDGNGHTINISINKPGVESIGLFRHIEDATIKNLYLEGSITGGSNVGALVGSVDGASNRIEGCSVLVDVTGSDLLGGLVGHGRSSGLTVEGCMFHGSFYQGSSDSTIGILVGRADDGSNISVSNNLYVKKEGQFYALLLLGGAGSGTNNYAVYADGIGGTAAAASSHIGLGKLLKDYGWGKAYEHGILYNGTCYVDKNHAIYGTGSMSDPFRISRAADWDKVANAVNGGDTFSGKFVNLTSDIDVSTMMGTDEANSFQGTFDGGGKKLTVSYNTSEPMTAPFRHVKNATIKNLHVAGTITTSNECAGGIVAESHGSLTLTDCRSSVDINSSLGYNTYGYHGGLVGETSGTDNTVVIDHCAFDGSFATTNNTIMCAGFVGVCGTTTTISNSIIKPSSVAEGMLNKTFAGYIGSYEPAITDCYYIETDNLPTRQGKKAYTTYPDGGLYKQITAANVTVYSAACTVSGIAESYDLKTGAVSITPVVTDPYGKTLSFDTDYSATMDGQNIASLPFSIATTGDKTLTITGKGNYAGSTSVAFKVVGGLDGTGVASDPYIIGSADDWNNFASYVSNGNNYSGQYVKLTADISVSAMVGSSEDNSFQGTFLGDGEHTLTFTQGSAESAFGEENCAPFRYVKNATFRDLKVAGSIYTSRKFAAGLVARCFGTTNITNCLVSTTIHSSVSNDGTHGGIVAMPASDTTTNITGCVYNGRLLTTNSTGYCGGFVGWSGDNAVTVTGSLYAPNTALDVSDGETAIDSGATFVRGNNPTIGTDCYYTETMGSAQGTQAYRYPAAPDNRGELTTNYGMVRAYANGLLFEGIYYLTSASITLADNGDNISIVNTFNGCVADVTLQGRTLYKDGSWNTLCLPFSVSVSEGSPLEGATIMTLANSPGSHTGFDAESGTLNLEFVEAYSVQAGVAHLVKWDKADDDLNDDDASNIVNPQFLHVTISAEDPEDQQTSSSDKKVSFIGTYNAISYTDDTPSVLLLGGGNTLYYPQSGASIGACRALFKLSGITAGEPKDGLQAVRAFNLQYADSDTSGITEAEANSSFFTLHSSFHDWYTIDGRRLQGKPSRAGVYINKGKKVVMK